MQSLNLQTSSTKSSAKRLSKQPTQLWLISIFSGLAALHLNLVNHLGEAGLFSSSPEGVTQRLKALCDRAFAP